MKFSASQSEVNILFPYVDFFNEFLDDWVGTETPDLIDFTPLDWSIGVDMQDYEIYLFTNRYNWLDISQGELENGKRESFLVNICSCFRTTCFLWQNWTHFI